MEDLMRNAVVLAHRQLLKLALAVALAVGTHGDSLDAGIVLLQPIGAAREASRLDLIQRVLVLFAWFQVGRMVLWEMQEELLMAIKVGIRSCTGRRASSQAADQRNLACWCMLRTGRLAVTNISS